MKLYTEEQVITFAIKVLSDYEINGTFYNREKLKEQLDATPIELPSDEEIYEESRKLPYEKHLDDGQYNDGQMAGFELGAYWMRQQILNQNK